MSIALSGVASAQIVPIGPFPVDITPSLAGLGVTAQEGESHDFHVAQVMPPFASLSNISIDWGDSSAPSTGAVDGSQVHATHTYAEDGTYTITVTADTQTIPFLPIDAAGSLDTKHISSTSTATIGEVNVNLQGEPQVISGGAFSGAVADGKDHDGTSSLSDFSAVIDWGDGSAPQTCTTCIVANAHGFDVNGTHQYAAAGVYTVATMVKDDGNDVREEPVTTTVVVPIVATAVAGAEGTQFSGTLGSVIPPRVDIVRPATAIPVLNTVTVNWGDGSDTSSATVGKDGTLTASHTYADEGTYTITLTGSKIVPLDRPGTTYTATNTVTIGDAPLQGTASASSPFTATAGTALSGVFGNVVDSNAGAPASDLSATIDWGDGSTGPATLVAATSSSVAHVAATGGWNATGSHTYTTSGTKNGTVHFVDKGGATSSVPFTVNVVAAQVQGITNTPTNSAPNSGGPGVISTPNTGADLPFTTAALLIAAGGSLFAVGRRRRS